MKKLSVYFIFFFISGISLAQSKKEMIAILTNRVDSLNQIVAYERSNLISERADKQKLNAEISNLKSQIKELERNKENLSNDKSALETKNTALNQELQENQGQIVELNKQLKIKQDSLVLVTTELLKYKPVPKKEIIVKQDNTGPIKTVTIGRQVWMLENLNVSTFKNGVAIPEVQDKDAWYKAGENKQPAWCYYENDPKNGAKYGKLYNWYAVIDNNGLCPQGWHVPSDAEWDTLVAYLGGSDVAGDKMKAKPVTKKNVEYYDVGGYDETKWVPCSNCAHWTEKQRDNFPCNVCKNTRGKSYKTGKYIPKTKHKSEHIETVGGWNGSNESGFTGLPGGYRDLIGNYYIIGISGYWWSSTEFSSDDAWYRLYSDNGYAYRYYNDKKNGMSVRCLKD
jgi:uncharacterized protein (TIGR02145 family)